MKRREFLKAAGAAAGTSLMPEIIMAASDSAPAKRPNIVIILADDQGWHDVGYHGSEIATPNIDRLTAAGVELDRFYVCPVCSPTRAGLMTGRYPIRFGMMRAVIPPWRKFGLPSDELTLPEALAGAGYKHRGIFGKWHLGHSDVKYHPLRRGFTTFYGHYNGAIDYWTHEREDQLDWHDDYKTCRDEGYSTNLLGKMAARFIQRRAKDGPFLCYVPFNAVHTPLQAPAEYVKRYKHLARPDDNRRQVYAGMVACMDENIGLILKAIDDAGIAEDTLVLYFSDNGGNGTSGHNTPLRGTKGTVFEGGIRVPASIRWPAGIPGGRKVTAMMSYMDVLPTLMRIAGIRGRRGKPLDGADMLDVIKGTAEAPRRDLFSYVGQGGPARESIALTSPKWKYVCVGPNVADEALDEAKRRRMLFRIDEDPSEKLDVAGKHPDIVADMAERVRQFRRLQPRRCVAPFGKGRRGFKAPTDWVIPGTPARS